MNFEWALQKYCKFLHKQRGDHSQSDLPQNYTSIISANNEEMCLNKCSPMPCSRQMEMELSVNTLFAFLYI